MKVRAAMHDDRKSVSELYHALHYDDKVKRSGLVPTKSRIKGIMLVAEENKKVIGFVWANFVHYGFSKFGFVEELFVLPEFRGRGIGDSLMRAVMRKLWKMDVESVLVTTEEYNEGAIRFYHKLGFKPCEGPWFYLEPEKKG